MAASQTFPHPSAVTRDATALLYAVLGSETHHLFRPFINHLGCHSELISFARPIPTVLRGAACQRSKRHLDSVVRSCGMSRRAHQEELGHTGRFTPEWGTAKCSVYFSHGLRRHDCPLQGDDQDDIATGSLVLPGPARAPRRTTSAAAHPAPHELSQPPHTPRTIETGVSDTAEGSLGCEFLQADIGQSLSYSTVSQPLPVPGSELVITQKGFHLFSGRAAVQV